jgi:hypothetical protein
MTKTEMQNQAVELFNQINTMYPVIYNSVGDDITRVVEYKGVKYELQYYKDTLASIYKDGADSSHHVRHIDKMTVKELNEFISIAKQVLKGQEIQDGPVLQTVQLGGKQIPFYSATIRFECELDAQRVIGVFAKVNDWSLDTNHTYAVFLDEYQKKQTSLGNPSAKLTISNEYSIDDVKAMLLVFDAELPDCHIAIQSLDYAQFDGLRDRSSHYPTDELVEEWSNKLRNLKKVA